MTLEKVLVSACLAGRLCRYDGGHSYTDLPPDIEPVLICPEEAGGLPTPRAPAEIVGGVGADVISGAARVVTCTGRDVTTQYVRGAWAALRMCEEQGINRAILKSRSPSCGVSAIYDGTFRKQLHPGRGVTAALLSSRNIAVEEM